MNTKTAAALDIRRLYHYQSFDKERLARIFTDETLYFSMPRDFNDPWDCRPFFNKSALDDPDEYECVVQWFVHANRTHNTYLREEEHTQREMELRSNRTLLEGMIDGMTSEIEKAIQEQYRVYCLSTQPKSTLMWAHYATSCRGVCLEFSVQNELFCNALPVEYLDSYPQFSVAATDEDENLRPLLTKSTVWCYENEFRLIVSEYPFVFPNVPTTNGGFLALPNGALQSVIVGAKMPASDREVVRTLITNCGGRGALKVATFVPDRYEFEITELKL